MRDDADYLNSTKALWLEQGNPIWLWLAIKSSSHNKHPHPQWVCALGFAAEVKLLTGHDDLGKGGVQLHHAAKNRLVSRRQSAHTKLNVCFVPIADKVKDRIATITLKGRQLPAAKVLAN